MKLGRIHSLKMRAGQTLLSVVFLAVVGALQAQSIHVAGKVTAAGIPVQNARITFIASDDRDRLFSTLTDGDGAFQIDIQTLVESQTSVPEEYFLAQNYPNPFSVSTAIAYFHDYPAEAWIAIYDVLGREVQRFSAFAGGGVREVIWDGADRFGNQVAPGLYFYRLQVGRELRVKKLLYLPDTAPHTGTRDAHFFLFLQNVFCRRFRNFSKLRLLSCASKTRKPQCRASCPPNLPISRCKKIFHSTISSKN
ncbi:MAG TPA: T9SS type A sorting domain-containing protein [bacterium]|nr:T9SS type A sorting domain-containing protein [bacterium]HPG46443.1 T9SS type A sorting domain-containing protein [bacterium]HPM98644.1 T9SS type A sorting domain-containing protein [bacterium]